MRHSHQPASAGEVLQSEWHARRAWAVSSGTVPGSYSHCLSDDDSDWHPIPAKCISSQRRLFRVHTA